MAYPSIVHMVAYFLLELALPLLLFLLSTFFIWYFQSKLVLHAYYKRILPVIRRNRVAYWLIGGAAVASHELLGHALAGAFTGSDAELFAQITPERSAVKIRARRTAWGYLSSMLATLAPCFLPPFFLIILAWFLFPAHISITGYGLPSVVSSVFRNFLFLLDIVFNSSLLLPTTLAFFYVLPVVSLTAGSSRTDFEIVVGQTRKYWYFAAFLFIVFAAGLEVVRMLLSLPSAAYVLYLVFGVVLLSFLLVMVGLFMGLVLSAYLSLILRLPLLHQLLLPLAFPACYVFLVGTGLRPVVLPYEYFFFYALLSSTAFSFLLAYAFSLVRHSS